MDPTQGSGADSVSFHLADPAMEGQLSHFQCSKVAELEKMTGRGSEDRHIVVAMNPKTFDVPLDRSGDETDGEIVHHKFQLDWFGAE